LVMVRSGCPAVYEYTYHLIHQGYALAPVILRTP